MLFLLELLKAYMCFWATGTLVQEIYFLNPQLLGTYALLPPPLKGGRRHQGVSPFYMYIPQSINFPAALEGLFWHLLQAVEKFDLRL